MSDYIKDLDFKKGEYINWAYKLRCI
jgi:hypothetical protein